MWIPIIIQIANGVAYLYENGYTHEDLTEEHIIVYKNKDCYHMKFAGLGNCTKKSDTDHLEDSFAFGRLINLIYSHLDQTHSSMSVIVSSLKDNTLEVKPTAREVTNKFNDIFKSGYFNH